MPSRTLFYQPSCGISGDMHLAAMLDLGVEIDWLNQELSKLELSADYRINVSRGQKMGISGTRIRVETETQSHHRHYSDILALIQAAKYPNAVTERALAIFTRLGNAEAKIHGIALEQVHFHEVGAVDAIVDITAAALCLEQLQVDHVLCAPVEVGSGFVDCAHGRLPIPAPATQELLVGAPCHYGGVEGECTTPTGAAILMTAVDEFEPQGQFTPRQVGYGVGHKDFAVPNVLRVALGDYAAPNLDVNATSHIKIEANIDDMSPEAYEPLMQALQNAGAVDVYLTPIMMKKGRPAQCLTALCHREDAQAVGDTLLNASSTIGLRQLPFEKRALPREERQIKTEYGDVRIKLVTQPDGRQRWKTEHDDVLALAHQHKISYVDMKRRLDRFVDQALENR